MRERESEVRVTALVIISLRVRFISKGSCHFRCASFGWCKSISKDDPAIHTRSAMRNIRGLIDSLEHRSKRECTCHFANTRGGTIAKESAATAVTERDLY